MFHQPALLYFALLARSGPTPTSNKQVTGSSIRLLGVFYVYWPIKTKQKSVSRRTSGSSAPNPGSSAPPYMTTLQRYSCSSNTLRSISYHILYTRKRSMGSSPTTSSKPCFESWSESTTTAVTSPLHQTSSVVLQPYPTRSYY